MKTFKTSGTGSGQSLSEIESERIPVYNTIADAEADLANLEEGQIVMTPDEGAEELLHPVDVVEEDNTHAVQSGAVANALSYSTTEQKTGGVWIDGKPIYRVVRKIWENGQPATGYTYSSNIISGPLTENAETIVNAYSINTGTNYRQAIMVTSGEAGPSQAFCWFSDNSAYFNYGANVYLAYAVFEYTKTTD